MEKNGMERHNLLIRFNAKGDGEKRAERRGLLDGLGKLPLPRDEQCIGTRRKSVGGWPSRWTGRTRPTSDARRCLPSGNYVPQSGAWATGARSQNKLLTNPSEWNNGSPTLGEAQAFGEKEENWTTQSARRRQCTPDEIHVKVASASTRHWNINVHFTSDLSPGRGKRRAVVPHPPKASLCNDDSISLIIYIDRPVPSFPGSLQPPQVYWDNRGKGASTVKVILQDLAKLAQPDHLPSLSLAPAVSGDKPKEKNRSLLNCLVRPKLINVILPLISLD